MGQDHAGRQPIYEPDALGGLLRRGVTHLEIWCTGRDELRRICTNRNWVAVSTLIERHGPATTMIMLARRTRCTVCGHLGAHVQPARPPAFGTPGHTEWLEDQLRRATELLKKHGRL